RLRRWPATAIGSPRRRVVGKQIFRGWTARVPRSGTPAPHPRNRTHSAGLSLKMPPAHTALERAEQLAERVLPASEPKRSMLVIVNPYASSVSDRLKNLVVYA